MERSDQAHVLIAGGGVAALEAALALRALAEDRVSVELLAPEPHFWYRPLAVAEPFKLGEALQLELSDLASRAGATFSLGSLESVDTLKHEAYTSAGGVVPFDVLLVACGAIPTTGVHGALTFRGPADTDRLRQLLAEIKSGTVRQVAFAVPWGAVWSLPAYELALMTASWLSAQSVSGVELALVTPEEKPLHMFGQKASDSVRALLDERGIAVHTRAYPSNFRDRQLVLIPEGVVEADRVVALPRLEGQRIDGISQTRDGFIRVDLHGRVVGVSDVYAAGDITTFRVKQGGIAAQQADAAAEAIAAAAGAGLAPDPFRPVLRGLLLTGTEQRYMSSDLRPGGTFLVSPEPLWWPGAKIVGRYLAPFLAGLAGTGGSAEPASGSAVPVEVQLDVGAVERRRDLLGEAVIDDGLREAGVARVGDVVSADSLVVAPEDTLGEVAERMRERDVGSVLVAEYGRLIGILTSRDMLRALAGRVHSSEARVRQWMTAEPITVSAQTALHTAAILMTEHHIHHLPVVEGERPVGMVGMREIVRARSQLGTGIGLGF